MTEIPGQQMDQCKTVSFPEYVSNDEVFPSSVILPDLSNK